MKFLLALFLLALLVGILIGVFQIFNGPPMVHTRTTANNDSQIRSDEPRPLVPRSNTLHVKTIYGWGWWGTDPKDPVPAPFDLQITDRPSSMGMYRTFYGFVEQDGHPFDGYHIAIWYRGLQFGEELAFNIYADLDVANVQIITDENFHSTAEFSGFGLVLVTEFDS